MKRYEVTLIAHYEKTISVYADSPEQAKAKIETVLFDTDLIGFSDDDFICGEASINDPCEDECEENDESLKDDCCSECANSCPVSPKLHYHIANGRSTRIWLNLILK